jgi:hypothetical protein
MFGENFLKIFSSWMSAEWAARPSQPIQPTSTTKMTHFATVNFSLIMLFIQNIEVPMNPFCASGNCNVLLLSTTQPYYF